MARKALFHAYRLLGARYPFAALVAQLQIAHVVVFVATLGIGLYEPVEHSQLVRLIVVAQALLLVDNLISARLLRESLAPVRLWLEGARSEEATRAAWRAAASLPLEFLRRQRFFPVVLICVPWSAYATVELELSLGAALALLAATLMITVYGMLLRFLLNELVMRPVVEDIAAAVPSRMEGPPVTVSLRWRLLGGLPLISVITGLAASGLSSEGPEGLDALGADVLAALGVAFSASLALTSLLARSVLSPLSELRAATDRVRDGDLDVRLPVTSTDEAGQLTSSFNTMVAGLRERERLRDALGAYVDTDVAERVVRGGPAVDIETLDLTIVFMDIRGYTAFAETATPADVVDRLRGFYETVIPIVRRNGGQANKLIADGLLAVFGVLDHRVDHADAAVTAAIESVAELESRAEFRIGVGINSGAALFGTIGGGGRLDFTVIGDTVNTAARAEAMTRETGDDVLLTDETHARLRKDHGGFVERSGARLRGKSRPVRLYAPVALEPSG